MRRGLLSAVVALGLILSAGAAVSADDTAVIKGKVIFKGDPNNYKREVLDTSKDEKCAKMVEGGKIGSEKVVLNKKTDPITIRNVLVSVMDGLGDRKFDVPKTPARLDQKGCQYVPHVLGVMEGQEVVIRNSDDTNHNIHFLPKVNEEFNKTQPKKDMEDKITLKAEDVFGVKCDVHPWMGAHVAVFKHPFFAVTGDDGTFELKGLPPGKYVIRAWHESFGEQSAEVEVKTGETKEKDFTYEPKK